MQLATRYAYLLDGLRGAGVTLFDETPMGRTGEGEMSTKQIVIPIHNSEFTRRSSDVQAYIHTKTEIIGNKALGTTR